MKRLQLPREFQVIYFGLMALTIQVTLEWLDIPKIHVILTGLAHKTMIFVDNKDVKLLVFLNKLIDADLLILGELINLRSHLYFHKNIIEK